MGPPRLAAATTSALTNDTVTIPAGSTTATVPVTIEPNGAKHNTPIVFNLVSAFRSVPSGNVTGQGNILSVQRSQRVHDRRSTMVTQSLVSSQTAEVPVTFVGDDYAANCFVNTADGTATAATVHTCRSQRHRDLQSGQPG